MKRWLQLIRIWFDWRRRVKGVEVIDWRRGPGYYLGLYKNYNDRILETPLQNGKIGIYKLLNIIYYNDPPDMIENSYWQLLGYKGQKPFSKMTFNEYCIARSK